MEVGEAVASAAGEPPPDDGEDVVRITIRISLFFDGTRNNRRNARVRQKVEQLDRGTYTRASDPAPDVDEATARAKLREFNKGDVSWAGDVTNVARLEENLDEKARDYTYYLHAYIEGIATTDLQGDSTLGAAIAIDSTGIVAKAETAVARAVDQIETLGRTKVVKSRTIIERLTVDMCGFSRGAAAARYCIHRVLDDAPGYQEAGWSPSVSLRTRLLRKSWRSVERVEVRAVGLFDTVSSYGLVADAVRLVADASMVGRFDGNVAVLHQKAVARAQAVYQIAAAEEYRANFALTNIDSAVAAGTGRQVYLPGAHSDIGGGYVDGAPERQSLVQDAAYCKDVADFVQRRGWYQDKEITFRLFPYREVRVERRAVANRYTFVPLGLMARFLRDQGVPVKPKLDKDFKPGPIPGLPEILRHADAVGLPPASGVAGTVSKSALWEEDLSPQMQQLRHGYLHVSFRTSDTGMSARLIDVSPWPLVPRYRPVRHVARG